MVKSKQAIAEELAQTIGTEKDDYYQRLAKAERIVQETPGIQQLFDHPQILLQAKYLACSTSQYSGGSYCNRVDRARIDLCKKYFK